MVKPRLPISVLALASYISSKGYECKIIDERLNKLGEAEVKRAGLVGMSTMSGAQLSCAIRTARMIRQIRPDVPIVWGGAHPTAFPEQTAQSDLVDCVVKGEGGSDLFEADRKDIQQSRPFSLARTYLQKKRQDNKQPDA